MVDPITIAMSNSLGLAGKSQGTAELAMTAQGAKLADSMLKADRVNETQKATAATSTENTKVANRDFKPRISRRNNNFPQPKQSSLGIGASKLEDSDGIAADAAWKTSGAQIIAPEQGSHGRQLNDLSRDPWSIATSARRLEQIDTDLIGRTLNRFA
jgi:hypothetical protein